MEKMIGIPILLSSTAAIALATNFASKNIWRLDAYYPPFHRYALPALLSYKVLDNRTSMLNNSSLSQLFQSSYSRNIDTGLAPSSQAMLL